MLICPICGKNKSRLIWQERKYKAYKCKSCKVVFLWPVLENPEKIYNEEYFKKWYLEYYDARKKYFKELFLEVQKFIGEKGKLLDVGCGFGVFLDVAAKKDGWEVYGQEVSPFAVDCCRKKGFEVFDKPLSELNLQENSFDVITVFDVIAHIKDPVSYIKTCKKILKPGGVLIIKTPYHSNSLFFLANLLSFTGKSRSLLHIPAQIFHFNENSLICSMGLFNFKPELMDVIPDFKSASLNIRNILKNFHIGNKSILTILKNE